MSIQASSDENSTMNRVQQQSVNGDFVWQSILKDVSQEAKKEAILASFLHSTVLKHSSLEDALSFHIASKLASPNLSPMLIRKVIEEALIDDVNISDAMRKDLKAFRERDPACNSYAEPLLYYKGFHALQSYRITHWLWKQERFQLALLLQNRISEAFGVDIHPAARIGKGIFIDHGTGVVIGETAIVEDKVSLLHEVTLGGTGNESGDRHPKVHQGVLIGAGAKILGNVHIGEGAKVGAGSVVLADVAPHTTVTGVPSKVVGSTDEIEPAIEMDHHLPD
ncbi:MAG: serine O-acetyltransferase [Acidobacteriia bacterium]|nr:serine O-acetyltransferase [Terriglobia bacterium]